MRNSPGGKRVEVSRQERRLLRRIADGSGSGADLVSVRPLGPGANLCVRRARRWHFDDCPHFFAVFCRVEEVDRDVSTFEPARAKGFEQKRWKKLEVDGASNGTAAQAQTLSGRVFVDAVL